MNMEKSKFANFENSYKINENGFNNNFFRSGDQEKKEIYIRKKILGVSGTLNTEQWDRKSVV